MASKASALDLLLVVFSSSFIISTIALLSLNIEKDPEVKLCKKQCWSQQQFDKAQKQQCVHGCDEYGRMKKEVERRTQPGVTQEQKRKLQHCKHERRVSRQSEQEKRRCVRLCEVKYWKSGKRSVNPKRKVEELSV